jgi:hypothetical protein
MVHIYSQQLAQRLLTKLAYSALLAALLCATVFFARAASQINNDELSIYDKRAPKDFLTGLFTTKQNKKLEAALLASLLSQTSKSVSKWSITELEAIQKRTDVLYRQLEQALVRIKKNVQKDPKLEE